MRVIQLIDSLRPGGAEKMAVNIANALLPHVEGSYLCCTRQEGMLKDELKAEVGYLFLNKKSRLDLKAVFGLKRFIKKYKIDIVHAHSTSYFMAGLLKMSGSNFKLIWHDHYGDSENLSKRDYKIVKKFSRLFAGIISVNTSLKEWAIEQLECKNVIEISNFISRSDTSSETKILLQGNEKDFKIICVANLRPQKDHFNLLKAFELLQSNIEVSLHLIGENPGTEYSESVLQAIQNSPVKDKIFYYGTQPDIISLLHQADLGVLASRSEGLPLILLEYGIAGLPIVCTDTGKCAEVIGEYGKIVKKENFIELSNGISACIQNRLKRNQDGKKFQGFIIENFSQEKITFQIVNFYCVIP